MHATSIYSPIQEQLLRVEERLKGVGDVPFPYLADLLDHVLDTTGKKARPALTLLAGGFHPNDGDSLETMATAVELLHIATLIHDDTVDNSDIRRGKATVSNLWGRNVAVVLGDFIFAVSATFVCDTQNIRVVRRFSETIMELSSGELREIADAYNADQSREQYLERIFNKTASLFTTAGESGAILSGASEDIVQALREYGHNLGMAFQIVDDILDFDATRDEVGKPVGRDLLQGVLTLPAIIALERDPADNPIIDLFKDPEDQASLQRAVDMIQNSSIIDSAYAVADEYCVKALACLEDLEPNPTRDSLEGLTGLLLTRRA